VASHAAQIEELLREGEHWRISLRDVTDAGMLTLEMFPSGPPPGVTIAEDVVLTEPRVVGSFLLGGLTSDTLGWMLEDYAAAFYNAGLQPYHSDLTFERSPYEGHVRTWYAGIDMPIDIPEEDAVALHADNWVDATLPQSLTVWDKIDDQVLTFQYANRAEYPVLLSSIELSGAPSQRLLNHLGVLIIPADEALNPVLSALTCPRMSKLRQVLNEKDEEIKAKQLEIGFAVLEFAKAIQSLGGAAEWKSPVDEFQSGLDTD
jgi:hypothetical protein